MKSAVSHPARSIGRNLTVLLFHLLLGAAKAESPDPDKELLQVDAGEAGRAYVSAASASEEVDEAQRLEQENSDLKRDLRAYRIELAKLRSKARQAEIMKEAEVSGQKALVEQLRKELAAARIEQAKSRQNLQEAHAEAGLWIQRHRATEDELAKLTLERMEGVEEKGYDLVRPQEKVVIRPAENDKRYEDLLEKLAEVSRSLSEVVTEHREAKR